MNWLIEQPDQSELVRACYFDRPVLSAAHRFWLSEEWTESRSLLPIETGAVLDVGAGMGIASYALAKDGWSVTSLEPDPSNLVGAGSIRLLATQAELNISVVEKWGESLPFCDAVFDVVYARQVLHHARNLELLCRELFRVLKPGGKLIVIREHVVSDASQLPLFLARHPLHSLYGGEHAFTLKEYLSNIRSAGFIVNRVLGPWSSIINYSPLTRQKLADEFLIRFGHLLGSTILSRAIFSRVGFIYLRRILAFVDRRPGRLFSFIAMKSLGSQ